MTPDLMTIEDFLTKYAVSKSTFYRLVNQGAIETVKIGSATRIPREAADHWLNSLRNGG